ncbi:M14 family metallopeptidase [Halobacterium jilantaiense]|uniref:Succinylglutamate desuccinylase / Aspartoacylase family protein n=1 Tax=Halobacterium jilantaiense TaxID=355548 RepID=A0A1I0MLY3_9EURY|nr:succinylglutamate desuccinylase/aspartoacylase family protein [Halobacterium jilantaiense]SEV88894.1 Succinylglutamate desuccinylase / Aspartoacylase family protein [Halobacterium jilantaiense]
MTAGGDPGQPGTEYVPPEVTVAGPGEPEVAVVGGVHGDEPSGVRAVRRLRAADLDLRRGVLFVVANPAAVAAGTRYLDSDLNRVFPGDPRGDREHRLAADLCELLGSVTTLSIHGTHSQREPFALVHRSQPAEYDLAAALPVEHAVDHSGVNEGTITTCGCLVEVEVGIQGTDAAADTAEFQARSFLQVVDALPGEPPPSTPSFFHMTGRVPKPPGARGELFVENFESVPEGAVYGRVDGRELVAEAAFYPILMSETGYADIFGYRGRKLGDSLAGVPASWLGR